MPARLDKNSADFDQRFAAFLGAKREASADVERATRAIVDDVAARGDAALIEATKKFDRLDIDAKGLRVTAANCPGTSALPMRWASSSAGAGARSTRSVSTFPAVPPPIDRKSVV